MKSKKGFQTKMNNLPKLKRFWSKF